MTEATEAAAAEQQAPTRSWKQTVLQIIFFQLVMRFIFPRHQTPVRNETGEVIPPLNNAFSQGQAYDLVAYITMNKTAVIQDFVNETPVWYVPNLSYTLAGAESIVSDEIKYVIPADLHDILLSQKVQPPQSETKASVKDTLMSLTQLNAVKHRQSQMKNWNFLYLIVFTVPRNLYTQLPFKVEDYMESIKQLLDTEVIIPTGVTKLIDYMPPQDKESELHSLLDYEAEPATSTDVQKEVPHWKNSIDIKIVVNHKPLSPQMFQNPYYKNSLQVDLEKNLFYPMVFPTDLWLLESNYIELNDTNKGQELTLKLSHKPLSETLWLIQAQLNEMSNLHESTIASSNPLVAMHMHSRREAFMLKRVLFDTNPYLLAFSAAFMFLHFIFSILAFKNDIQFWKQNDSMQGLSALSIVANFICELIIGLYLYDSNETSGIILFEIFFGLALSAWKVTKAISFSIDWSKGIPRFRMSDKRDYEESLTKKYDRVAIKFMSILLIPVMGGYFVYALKYKKFKSWYSFIISTLAGSVYAFGFITMTPQLYINYKLKSVDHLPWRAFTYKALNTFVDDIAAFIIDMPWMHRLACFRDDVIFVCYLYQRWIYSVDKTRPSQWVNPEEQKKALEEKQILLEDEMRKAELTTETELETEYKKTYELRERAPKTKQQPASVEAESKKTQ